MSANSRLDWGTPISKIRVRNHWGWSPTPTSGPHKHVHTCVPTDDPRHQPQGPTSICTGMYPQMIPDTNLKSPQACTHVCNHRWSLTPTSGPHKHVQACAPTEKVEKTKKFHTFDHKLGKERQLKGKPILQECQVILSSLSCHSTMAARMDATQPGTLFTRL